MSVMTGSVEQVQSRDGGLLWLLVLMLGHLDPAHGDHSTDGNVRRHAGHAQPEGPIQAVVQDGEEEEVLPVVGNSLRQMVAPHGRQETQHTQGTTQSWRRSNREREIILCYVLGHFPP